MKSLNIMLFAAICSMTFTACGTRVQASTPGLQGNNPYAVQPGDGAMIRGDVRIDSADVSLAKSNPPQVMLHFAYFQPTPCFSLRVDPGQPDAQGKIHISA